jgi:hypothetical protein
VEGRSLRNGIQDVSGGLTMKSLMTLLKEADSQYDPRQMKQKIQNIETATKENPVIFYSPTDSVAVYKEGGKYVVHTVDVRVGQKALTLDPVEFDEFAYQKNLT